MESFNGKLRDELLNGELFYTLHEAQVLIEQWRCQYNTQRPHASAEEFMFRRDALAFAQGDPKLVLVSILRWIPRG
jgi:transposase InsO family protein